MNLSFWLNRKPNVFPPYITCYNSYVHLNVTHFHYTLPSPLYNRMNILLIQVIVSEVALIMIITKNSFEAKKRGSVKFKHNNLVRIVSYKMSLISLYFVKYTQIFITLIALWKN